MRNTLILSQNCLTHGKNSVIMTLFSIENVFLFPEVLSVSLSEYSVIKRDFNGNRSVPSIFVSDIEYSVIMSDVIKSFDCISK